MLAGYTSEITLRVNHKLPCLGRHHDHLDEHVAAIRGVVADLLVVHYVYSHHYLIKPTYLGIPFDARYLPEGRAHFSQSLIVALRHSYHANVLCGLADMSR